MELAHQGTKFLDEVGSLDISLQAKLLQVLQDGSFMRVGAQESRKVNTRLICAANGNLKQQTEDGSFRLDFFYRINAITIDLPPLRQRAMDLPVLIDYFLELHSKAYRANAKPLSRELMRLMQRYNWPGNIRQLENMIRTYVLIGSEEALAADLVPSAPAGPGAGDRSDAPCFLEGDNQGRDAEPGENDHYEGAAGQWLEPPENGEMAQDQLQVATLQASGIECRSTARQGAEDRSQRQFSLTDW